MAYYDALVTKWATLTPGTTDAKLAQINAITVSGPAQRMIIPSYDIYNCLDATEFGALSAANQAFVRDLLNMGSVDASPGKPARTRMLALFGAGTTTRANLTAMAVAYDTPPLPWWKATVAQGGGALNEAVGRGDLINAGNLT